MAVEADAVKCPRCETEWIMVETIQAGGGPEAAFSRTSRNENDALILVCSRCGQREAHADPWGDVKPPTSWPLSIDELVAEERGLLAAKRGAVLGGPETDGTP